MKQRVYETEWGIDRQFVCMKTPASQILRAFLHPTSARSISSSDFATLAQDLFSLSKEAIFDFQCTASRCISAQMGNPYGLLHQLNIFSLDSTLSPGLLINFIFPYVHLGESQLESRL